MCLRALPVPEKLQPDDDHSQPDSQSGVDAPSDPVQPGEPLRRDQSQRENGQLAARYEQIKSPVFLDCGEPGARILMKEIGYSKRSEDGSACGQHRGGCTTLTPEQGRDSAERQAKNREEQSHSERTTQPFDGGRNAECRRAGNRQPRMACRRVRWR